MNLHLLPDSIYSEKFMDFIEKYFSLDEHFFLIITPSRNVKFVNSNKLKNLSVIRVGSYFDYFRCINNKNLKNLFIDSERVYIHSLGGYNSILVFRYAKPMQQLIWLSWGYDIYGDLHDSLLEDETKEIAYTPTEFKRLIKNKIIKPFKKNIIARLDYIAMDYEDEYKLVLSNYKTNALYREFHYPNPINFTVLDIKPSTNDFPELSKVNQFDTLVQVGNSGSPNNNHLSILRLLNGLENKSFAVICPLSYGNPVYIDRVIRIGYELLGERFIPLIDFLKPDIYFALLNRVDVAIMNHYRQQGKGNIIPLIYLGKKIYLRENTTTFKALCSMGIKPGSIDNLMRGETDDFLISLTHEEIESNKIKIKQAYSEEECYRKIKNLFFV